MGKESHGISVKKVDMGRSINEKQYRRKLAHSIEIFKNRMEKYRQLPKFADEADRAVSIVDEFPYSSLDCSFVPLKRSPPIEGDLETLYSSLPPHIEKEINRLKTEKDIEGLRKMISHLSALNLQWGKGGSDSLFDVYVSLEWEAKNNSWDKGPDPACISRILCAMKTLSRALEVLGDILMENPRQAEITLKDLSEEQREQVMMSALNHLFTDNFELMPLLDFFSALSEQNGRLLLRTMNSFLVIDPLFASRLDLVADNTQNPFVNKAVKRIVEKWRIQIREWNENGEVSSDMGSSEEI